MSQKMNAILEEHSLHSKKLCEEAQQLYDDKNRKYRAAYEGFGLLGATGEINAIAARLRAIIVYEEIEFNEKALTDMLRDLHNYANIAQILLSENNILGREWTGDIMVREDKK